MHHVDLHDRRIVVARIESCDTVEEAKAIGAAVGGAIRSAPGLVVATADFRRATVFQPAVTDVFVAILRSDNPHLERSAHVLGKGATLTLQLERVVREANSPARRTYHSADEAELWLAELLTPLQAAWLHAFYAAGAPR